jgi:hypothetical protein
MLTIQSDAQGPRIRGQRLASKRSEWNPYADRGRTAVLKAEGFAAWRTMGEGGEVWLPSFDGEGFAGVVALSVEDAGWVRIGGELRDVRGTFALHTNFREVRGSVLLQDAAVAYEISTDSAGEVVMVERPMEALLCVKFRPATRLP